MTKIVAITNNKGGVAKTTTAFNLGGGLAKQGKRVLLIDLDPQSNLSSAFKLDVMSENNIGSVLLKRKTLNEVLHRGELMDILPASLQMIGLEKELISATARESLLKNALSKQGFKNNYDWILIDCPPNLGAFTANAFVCSDLFLVPFQTEFFSFTGLSNILHFAEAIKEDLNPDLELCGILLTKYNDEQRGNVPKTIAKEVRKNELVGAKVFKTSIRQSISLMESPMSGLTVFDYAPQSNGAKDYKNLTQEILTLYV